MRTSLTRVIPRVARDIWSYATDEVAIPGLRLAVTVAAQPERAKKSGNRYLAERERLGEFPLRFTVDGSRRARKCSRIGAWISPSFWRS